MGDNRLRKGIGENLVLTHRLKPITIGHLLNANFKIVVVLGNGVPNASLMEHS